MNVCIMKALIHTCTFYYRLSQTQPCRGTIKRYVVTLLQNCCASKWFKLCGVSISGGRWNPRNSFRARSRLSSSSHSNTQTENEWQLALIFVNPLKELETDQICILCICKLSCQSAPFGGLYMCLLGRTFG